MRGWINQEANSSTPIGRVEEVLLLLPLIMPESCIIRIILAVANRDVPLFLKKHLEYRRNVAMEVGIV